MSEIPKEPLPPQEIIRLLEDKPYLVQRLGYVANNAGIFREFQELVIRYDCSYVQLKAAVKNELRAQGVHNADDLLRLFDIPDEYDD